jgi:hypothetical protein
MLAAAKWPVRFGAGWMIIAASGLLAARQRNT